MNHQNILKESWRILYSYRLLWILGFVLALTTCSWQGTSNLGERYDSGQRLAIKTERGTLYIPGFEANVDLTPAEGFQISLPYEEGQPITITRSDTWSVDMPWRLERDWQELTEWLNNGPPPELADLITGSVLIIAGVIITIFLMAAVARYTADASLIRAVNQRAKTGQKVSFGRLLHMGFSRAAWRFFLIDLVIRLPLLLLFLVLLLLSLTPLSLWATGDAAAGLFGMTTAGLLITGVMILAIVINAVLSVLIAFFRRACALEELGVLAAIGRGFSLVRHNLSDVFIMAIFAFAATIAWVILFIPAMLLLIPVLLVCVVMGALAGLAIFVPLTGVASLVTNQGLALVLAGSIALAVFIPIVIAPILFLSGLLRVYISSLWTLSYRELRTVENALPEPEARLSLAKA
jgi:hypothetical protein